MFISFHMSAQEATLAARSQTLVHLVLIWSSESLQPSLITGWESDQYLHMLLDICLCKLMHFGYFTPISITGCSCGGKSNFFAHKTYKKKQTLTSLQNAGAFVKDTNTDIVPCYLRIAVIVHRAG